MSDYKQKSVKNHPLFPGRQTAEVHRVVMAEKLGRPLQSDEWVHHRDEDKTNFDGNNLEVMTPKAHAKLHLGGKKRPGVAAKLRGRKHSSAAKKKMVEAALRNREARSRAGKANTKPKSTAHKTSLSRAWTPKRRKAQAKRIAKLNRARRKR